MREFSGNTRLGPELGGLEIRTYRRLLPNGEYIYSSEVELKPGDTIAVDSYSSAIAERRLREIIPVSLLSRGMEELG